jgi:hypothetical protein
MCLWDFWDDIPRQTPNLLGRLPRRPGGGKESLKPAEEVQVQRDFVAVPVGILVRRLGAERPGLPAPDGAPGLVQHPTEAFLLALLAAVTAATLKYPRWGNIPRPAR